MPDAKIEITIGTITFQAEGEQKWVADQLDKLFTNAKDLSTVAPVAPVAPVTPAPHTEGDGHTPIKPDAGIAAKPLATFLKEKNATTNQVQKFLATAVRLESKGKNRIATADVTKSLKDSNQTRLGNPADCLNKNVSKGYCEKDGKEFFVTQEGKDSL